MLTMDAEYDLPPLLRVAFARNPKAAEGWERMSVLQRRGHLMGISITVIQKRGRDAWKKCSRMRSAWRKRVVARSRAHG